MVWLPLLIFDAFLDWHACDEAAAQSDFAIILAKDTEIR